MTLIRSSRVWRSCVLSIILYLARKDTKIFASMQINGEKVAIFWCKVYGVKAQFSGRSQASYRLEVRGEDSRENWTKWWKIRETLAGGTARLDRWREASAPIQLGANGPRSKNTRIAFGTMNIGAHAKTHMRCTIVSQTFQERVQLF